MGNETEERVPYQIILDRLPQMVWANLPGGETYYNLQWQEFTGIRPRKGLDVDRSLVIHPEDREHALHAWRDAQRTGHYEAEYRMRHQSGEYRWIISRGKPQYDDNGNIIAWYGSCTDIHARKLALEALERSEALNRSLIHCTPDPILLLDCKGRIIFMNNAAADELPLGVAEAMIGEEWVIAFELGHGDGQRALAQAMKGERARFSMEYPAPEGPPKWWDLLLNPVTDSGGEMSGIMVIARDLTDVRAAQNVVEELEKELIHASRHSAMATMAATLAHELNQPLAAIANYANGLRRIAAKDEGNGLLSEASSRITECAVRAGEVIRRMRSMAQEGGRKRERIHLSDMIRETTRFHGLQAENVRFRYDFGSSADIYGDRIQIQQVLINLVRNACEAVQGGMNRVVTVSTADVGTTVRVCVSDTGHGIAPDLMEHLFEAKVSTKPGGTGIGLSISRTIVENHGGKLWAENTMEGARFCFSLPVASGSLSA